MFLCSLIEELCTKEENNKPVCTLTFGGQCRLGMRTFNTIRESNERTDMNVFYQV